jgi:Tfp pilus assembly protein PilV
MATQNYTLITMRKQAGSYKKNNIQGITLLEALVAVVIVAIGFLSVYQLSSYAVNSIDGSIDRNKINFLS